jgi:uncharacterized protein
MTVSYLVESLNLLPHPEGGYYKETYRSNDTSSFTNFNGERNIATSIYFLIESANFSALHKIKSDETWHFYYGDALEVIEIDLQGKLSITSVGSHLKAGEVFQYTVKANHWFGSRVKQGGSFSLVGCTVAPGFDFNDFELAQREQLVAVYPQHQEIIVELTR